MRVMLASEAGSPDVRNDDWAGATSTAVDPLAVLAR
jgi:hypothetical protein